MKKSNLPSLLLCSTFFIAATSFADTVVDGLNSSGGIPFVPPLVTNVAGNISIVTGGKIDSTASATDAIQVNDANRLINVGGDGILAGADFAIYDNGLNMMLDNDSAITAGTSPFTPADAIFIDQSFLTIDNSGIIVSPFQTAVNINNAVTGNIMNSGIIHSGGGANQAAILINSNYSGFIINTATGSIESNQTLAGAGGAAIRIANNFNTFNNSGVIKVLFGNNYAILVSANSTGTINSSGTIKSISAPAIQLDANLTGITSTGSIESFALPGVMVAAAGATMANGFSNAGDITQLTGNTGIAIDFSAVGANIPLTQNGGTITGKVFLSGAGGFALTLNSGTIDGTVTSSSTASSTLNLHGGEITQPLTMQFNTNVINLTGTTTQTISLADGDVINVSGGSFMQLNGANNTILNIENDFTSGIINNVERINVNNPGTVFTVAEPITGLESALTVNPDTTMIVNANMSGDPVFKNDGIFHINENIIVDFLPGGIVSNNNAGVPGVELIIEAKGLLQTGIFFQNLGDTLTILGITEPTNYGKIQASDTATLDGGFIKPIVTETQFIPDNTEFNVIQSDISITDNSSLVQPNSPLFFFTKSGVNGVSCNGGADTCVQLTLHRNTLSSITGGSPVANPVANALDSIIAGLPNINADLAAVLMGLDTLTTQQAIIDALESLAPPFNYALAASSHVSMDKAFDSAQVRLEDLRRIYRIDEEIEEDDEEEGASFGDGIYPKREYNSFWAKAYGVYQKQGERNHDNYVDINGYRIQGSGLSIGVDWQLMPCTVFGIAASYLSEFTQDKWVPRNTISTYSYQATFYGWIESDNNVYIDMMLGYALHNYDTRRNIVIGNYIAFPEASFWGWQAGAQMDIGHILWIPSDFYVAPFLRLKYTYLNINPYSEDNAGGVGLHVNNSGLNEAIGGLGLRLALKEVSASTLLVPELWFTALYDFAGQAQDMQSNFLGGGIAFNVDSISPAQMIYQIGVNFNMHFSDCYLMSVKYNLELRDQFVGNDAYILINYTWG